MKEVLYQKIAAILAEQIRSGTLAAGNKMPSVRTLYKEYGVSKNTAIQAYLELEARGMILSRPRSGYFVSYRPNRLPVPNSSSTSSSPVNETPEELISKIYNVRNDKSITRFSLGVPENELLPIARLNKELVAAMRSLPGSGTEYDEIQGSVRLRRDIARLTYSWSGDLTENDIVTTSGAMNAISLSLIAITRKGDTIAVESPVYFGILHLAQSLGLKVLELPSHPLTGIELPALKKVLPKISACILVSNFNNPTGSTIPDDSKKELVQMLALHGIPLIEDDLYGDIYFGKNRPKPCKAWDEEGLVLWCGSTNKTLAPGYRVGWMAPGKFRNNIIHQKLMHTISTTTITQNAVANFLEKGRYEHHLRNMRNTLHGNSIKFSNAIANHFPEGTKISRPEGGFMLWVELDKKINAVDVYERAIRQKISIAPGGLFSLQNKFHNCMRLSYGQLWSDELEGKLELLGRILKKML